MAQPQPAPAQQSTIPVAAMSPSPRQGGVMPNNAGASTRETNKGPAFTATIHHDNSDQKKIPDFHNLMSPPDAPLHDFPQSSQRLEQQPMPPPPLQPQQQRQQQKQQPQPQQRRQNFSPVSSHDARTDALVPISPPVSPRTKAQVSPSQQSSVADPILYPNDELSTSPAQRPLFGGRESAEHRDKIDAHIASRDQDLFSNSPPPQREEYELTLQFKSQVFKMFSKDPAAWKENERRQLAKDMKANQGRWGVKRYPAIAPAKAMIKATNKMSSLSKPKSSVAKADRVVKPSQPRPSPAPRARATGGGSHAKGTSGSPERRIVAPNREDRDFVTLRDVCPPLSSLPDKPNSLKVDWKGSPVDLSGDPHAHLLHPDEISLAANLRLDCATYLTSKRRMFLRRLECANIPKEFRKTDAQQACKIDVNKASKLWVAFEKVGWLDIKWMKAHLV